MAKKTKDFQYYEGIGRRKEAVARVRLYIVGKDKVAVVGGSKIKAGEIVLNQKPISGIYLLPHEKSQYLLPLKMTNNEERFAISITTKGGGKVSQLQAIIHGMARSIEKIDKEAYHHTLKKHHLLTRDPRTRERRKVGMGGKSRREKQSPKR